METDDYLSLSPLVNCVKALEGHKGLFSEIVIADFESYEDPMERLEHIGVDIKLIKVKGQFSRGKGRNIAFRHSTGDAICFLDADMLVENAQMFKSGRKIVESGGAYFPICYSFYDHQNKNGWWRSTGFGNLIVSREHFNKYGWWKEKISWGGEDDDMYLKLSRSIPIIRTKAKGFYHQWHPESPTPFRKRSWFQRLMNK